MIIDDYIADREFESERHCEFCNSLEGKPILVDNYIVNLLKIVVESKVKLACQGCRIKERNFINAERNYPQSRSLLKRIFSFR